MANPESAGRYVRLRRGGTAALVAVTLALAFAAIDVGAFKPTYHEQITEAVLRSLGFDDDSADEAGDSNYWTDYFEPGTAGAHADNNRLGAASQRLIDKRTIIGEALNSCQRRDALDALGEALHTVQDIYSHSNAVDNGHTIGDLLSLSDGSAACDPAANFAPGGLVTGFFSTLGWATGNQCRGTPAGSCCHRDLNKDDPGQTNGGRHPEALKQATSATRVYLGLVEDDIRSRFPDRAEQLINLFKRKQRTAVFVIDDTGSMSNDIAGVKAAANSFLNSVVAAGESPTLGLVTYKDDVSNRGVTCNNLEGLRSQINGLFAAGGGDCPEVMNAGLLAGLDMFPIGRSDIQIQGGRILLATDASARDPQLGPSVADLAIARGVSIDAILTGDCAPEESSASATVPVPGRGWAAGLYAGYLSLWDRLRPLLNLANARYVPIAAPASRRTAFGAGAGVQTGGGGFNPLTSNSARTYLRALTEQTGGVLFNVSRVEVDDVAPTLLSLSAPDAAIVVTQRIEGAPGSSSTVDLPIDETFRGPVTFMVTASTASGLPTVELRRPDGTLVQATDPGVSRRALTSVISYVIQSPAIGTWQATLTGGARAFLRVFGSTSLRFNGLRYFAPDEMTSRPEVDVARFNGVAVAGARLLAEARLTVAPNTAALRFRRLDGGPLAEPVTTARDARRFQAPVVIPNETFLVELTGLTTSGNLYVRQLPTSVVPRTVAIHASPDLSLAAPGTAATIKVTVSNASSSAATYTLQASSTLLWPIIAPAPFSVAAGATVTVDVLVTVPADTPAGTRNDVTLVVQDATSPSARNTTRVAVVAGESNQPPVCSGASPSVAQLWPPDHSFTDVSILGLSDPDGDIVTATITGITQDEAPDASGSGRTGPDGEGVGTSIARVRAERAGNGDGRVYMIGFRADDGKSGSCTGSVSVGVPHSRNGSAAVDSGQRFVSTGPR